MSEKSLYCFLLYFFILCLVYSTSAEDITCEPGFSPPITSVNPVIFMTGQYPSLPAETHRELQCNTGYLVCGVSIFRLSSAFTGNINIIRDVSLKCCSLSGASNYMTPSLNYGNNLGFYDSSFTGYYQTFVPVLFDIKQFSFSKQGLSLGAGDPFIPPVLFGTDTSTLVQNCPIGSAVNGLYAQAVDGGGGLTFFERVSVFCSVRCAVCPADFFCIGNSSAIPCPSNSRSRNGSKTVGDCACISGFTNVQSVCYCPIGMFLPSPASAECLTCPPNFICAGDNLAVPCPNHSELNRDLTCVCSPGYYSFPPVLGASGVCLECVSGNYCTNGTMSPCWRNSHSMNTSGTCKCDAGFYSVLNSCNLCPVGSYCLSEMAPAPCPPGTYSELPGASQCTQCPPNSGSSSTGGRSVASCVCAPGFVVVTGSTTCFECAPGLYCPGFNDTSALPCGPGTFQTGHGIADVSGCTKCAAGTFSGDSFASSPTVCTLCSIGSYHTGLGATGSSECQECPRGTFGSQAGISTCVLCSAGTIQITTGVTTSILCSGCLPGTFQTGLGMGLLGDCKQCPSGTFQTGTGMASSVSCTLCRAGTYQSNMGQPFESSCLACKEGKFQTKSGAKGPWACESCSRGTYQSLIGSTQNCTLCGKGTYLSVLGAQSSSVCTGCMRGTFSSHEGATSFSTCRNCSLGTYQTGTGMGGADSCIPCPRGTFQSMMGGVSSIMCVMCPAGTYQPWLEATAISDCLACGPGTYQSGIGADSDAGCIMCQPGTYQTASGASSASHCLLCSSGKYLTGSGSSRVRDCISCSAGSYQTTVGSMTGSGCILCGPGTFQSALAASSPLDCNLCSSGTFQTGRGAVRATECVVCGQGAFSSGLGMGGSRQQVCGSCMAGTYQSSQEAGASTCTKCEPGKFQTAGGQSNCDLCREGTFQPYSGAHFEGWCTPCDQGTYSSGLGVSSIESCKSCGAGLYSGLSGLTACHLCKAGMYSPNPRASMCFSCMSGMYSNQTGSSACLHCPIGKSMPDTGETACVSCVEGQFQYLEGKTSCFPCQPGSFQSFQGSSVCTECSPGQYQPLFNQSSCFSCAPGTRAASPGATSCQVCPPGRYQPSPNSTSCFQCGQGEFQDRSQQTTCLPCAPGFYVDSPVATSCLSCPRGEFQPGAGLSACIKCEEGTYHTSVSSVSSGDCLNCSAGFFSGLPGATACGVCPAGSFTSSDGLTACNLCWPGTFQEVPRGTTCYACALGSFSTAWGVISEKNGCVLCPAGMYSSSISSTFCSSCALGESSDKVGATNCSACTPGTYMAELGWAERSCVQCAAGTFSSAVGATTSEACALCDNGYFSSRKGQTSHSSCIECKSGTVSVANKTLCRPCGDTEFCPAGYDVPIKCVWGLSCNGTHMESAPGLLAVLQGNCTGVLPCPPGTQCFLQDLGLGKGILGSSPNRTHFVIFQGGNMSLDLSCPGNHLKYGYTRVDWPFSDTQGFSLGDVLYWLQPLGCPAGTFLHRETCTPCPSGTFSVESNALDWDTCLACPVGSFGALTGATSCPLCSVGEYSDGIRSTVCQICAPGLFQGALSASTCLSCPTGTYSTQSKSGECDLCNAGTYQSEQGATSCDVCAQTDFSSPGDTTCSRCGTSLNTLDSGFSCASPTLPQKWHTSVWISLRGELDSDECLSTGPSRSSLATVSNNISVSYVILKARAVCTSTLYIADRPELSRTWNTPVGQLLRPVSLTVVAFNNTFYPELCKNQGFGVVFTVLDPNGNMLTDLSGANAVMSLLDPSGQNVLFSIGCSRLPQDPNANVPMGVCRTSFCPTMKVIVRVSLTWVGMTAAPIRGEVVVTPGPLGVCQPSSSWSAAVDLQIPSVPYLPGETFTVVVSSINPPFGGTLVVFRFALQILSGVSFVSFQSPYSVVTETVGDVLSVVGDSSQGGGAVLAILKFRLDVAASGVILVGRVLPSSFQFTLANAVPYTMPVRTWGFSCRTDGYVDLLADVPKTTSLITNLKSRYVINWRRIQSNALDSSTSVYTVSVNNVMHSFASVLGVCTSLEPRNLVITSCNIIRAGVAGNVSAHIRVEYQQVTAVIPLVVLVPTNVTFATIPSVGSMSGRYRITTVLSAGSQVIRNVDATPFIPNLRAFGVTILQEQWRCAKAGTSFTLGAPSMYSGVCGNITVLNSRQSVVADSFFLVSGSQSGVTGVGTYTFPQPVISSSSPTGGILVFSSSNGLSLGIGRITSLSPVKQLAISAGPATVTLQNMGGTARCMPVKIEPSALGGWQPFTALIPVFPAGPIALQITLSAYVIVSQQETSMFIPTSTFVVRASLVFSDGGLLPVHSDTRLRTSSSTLVVTGLGAVAREDHIGASSWDFSFVGIPCVSTSVSVQVLASSVREVSLICPSCPPILASEEDPLSQHSPRMYPSSFPVTAVLVRRYLFDGRIVDRVETVAVTDGPLVSLNGFFVGKGSGSATIASLTTPSATPLTVTVLHRWATSWELRCNNQPCSTNLKLAPKGDGAAEPPFLYSTVLSLSLSLGLQNGTTVSYPWLPDVVFSVNQTVITGSSLRFDLLVYGEMVIQCVFGVAWNLPALEISNGHLLQVEQMQTLTLHGPSSIQQIHRSGLWEEGRVITTATLTDGVVSDVAPLYTSVLPLAIHNSTGFFHAEYEGSGSILALFGDVITFLNVSASDSSLCFTSLSLESIPSVWTSPIGLPLKLSPQLIPVLSGGRWFDTSLLLSRVINWNTSLPDIVQVDSDTSAMTLLSDSWCPVDLNATLIPCGESSMQVSASKSIVVNVQPSRLGDFDFGSEVGRPLPAVELGRILSIPVYLYVSTLRLQSYMVEILLPGSGTEPLDCAPGVLPNSQCALVAGESTDAFVFRSVGAFSQSQLSGRLLVATVRIQVFLDTLAPLQVRLLQAIAGEDVSVPPHTTTFMIKLGNELPPLYGLATTFQPTAPLASTSQTVRVYGDTDGDGFFTAMDVLFMEKYMALLVYGRDQLICIEKNAKCQSASRLTVWQLLQLKPVRHPGMPASRPDGSDVIFLLRALVGKAFFLVSLDVVSRPGSLGITVQLSDYAQILNPFNAVVSLEISTTANRNLAFDTPFQYNPSTSVMKIVCKRTSSGFRTYSLPASSTFDEPNARLRVGVQALDRFGSDLSSILEDRVFMFKPSEALAVFNIMAPSSLLPETVSFEYLPTLNCQVLCKDSSLFLDQSIGLPEWINDTSIYVNFFGPIPPTFGGFWPFSPKMSPLEEGSTVLPSISQGTREVLIGNHFNISFSLSSELSKTMHMFLFTVETSRYLPLLQVYGAELWYSGAPVFFVNSIRSNGVIILEFEMIDEGDHDISIIQLDSFPAVVSFSSGVNVLRQTWVGIQPGITKLLVTPLCRNGVILWSKLNPSFQDEACQVLVVSFWQPLGEQGASESFTCQTYPCVLQGFGQVIRPIIKAYIPSNPSIRIQKPVLSLGQKTQWRVECFLDNDESTPVMPPLRVTVTRRALESGLIRVVPFNALVATADSIRSIKTGWATISFGGLIKSGVNTTETFDPPRELNGFAFTSIGFTISPGVLQADFSKTPLVAGQRGFLFLQALYRGGYTLLLDPTPSGMDSISIKNASRDIIVSQIDGSFYVNPRALGGDNQPIVQVTFQGISLLVSATVIPLVPISLVACCDQKLASSTSVIFGHRDFPSSFTLDDAVVELSGKGKLTLGLTDARIRMTYDWSHLQFSRITKRWTMGMNAPRSGLTSISLQYTHPGSLLTLDTVIQVFFVDADRLDVSLPSDPPLILKRIHCSKSSFQKATITGLLHLISGPLFPFEPLLDVTDLLVLLSSDGAVVNATNTEHLRVLISGVGVGSAEITAVMGGLSSVFPVEVVDQSLVFQALSTPPSLELFGAKDVTRIPFSVNGSLADGSSMIFRDLWAVFGTDMHVIVTGALGFVTVSLDTGSLILHRNTHLSSSLSVQFSLPLCLPFNQVQLSAVSVVNTHLIANVGSSSSHLLADVEIAFTSPDVFEVTLVCSRPVLAWFVQLWTDSESITKCIPREDLPLFSDCSINYPSIGSLVLAAARSVPFQFPGRAILVDIHAKDVATIWGFVEVYDGISASRFSIQAGEFGDDAAGPGAMNHSVRQLMPGLPTVDSSVISRCFRGLFSVPRTYTVREAMFNLFILVGRQRHVDSRIYSNEFELSAMFRVSDRFLQPDVNRTSIRVLFHTNRLPSLPGSVLVPSQGLWASALHVLDGWYVVEFRQKIPELQLAVSFEVSTSTSLFPWPWEVDGLVDTGRPLPQCPRSAAHTASFMASYHIVLPSEISNSTDDNLILQGLAAQVACSVQVANRRVLATRTDKSTITLSVALESLARIHQANLFLLSGWLSKEMDRRLGMLNSLHAAPNMSLSQVDRGDINYINDTSDPPTPCPYGYYFSRNGTYVRLPAHATAGVDCYDMFCMDGYTLITESGRCIPTPVSMDVIWICVLLILTVVICLAALLCCVQLALWKTATDITDVVFDPSTPQCAPDNAPPVHDWTDKHSSITEDIVFEDSDEREAYFQNIVTDAGMDDLSAMIVDDMDDFSSPFTTKII